MTIHNQYHPAALQKFVTLPKIPKIVSYLVHSKYTNGAMVVVVTFDASLGRRTEVHQQRDRPTCGTEITKRLVVFAFRELGERFALHDDVAHLRNCVARIEFTR